MWVETPSNPLLSVPEIAAPAGVMHARAGCWWSTAPSYPGLQQRLALGANVVVHSTTKCAGVHSDVVGGALVVADAELGERLARSCITPRGAVAGPFDAWLALRG